MTMFKKKNMKFVHTLSLLIFLLNVLQNHLKLRYIPHTMLLFCFRGFEYSTWVYFATVRILLWWGFFLEVFFFLEHNKQDHYKLSLYGRNSPNSLSTKLFWPKIFAWSTLWDFKLIFQITEQHICMFTTFWCLIMVIWHVGKQMQFLQCRKFCCMGKSYSICKNFPF